MFFTLNRRTLQLNMRFWIEHVLHAEPLHTSAKHAHVVQLARLSLMGHVVGMAGAKMELICLIN